MAVISVTYLSQCLQRYVDIKVVLPIEDTKTLESNAKHKPVKFKTLYLLHGYTGACGDWLYGSRIYKLARDRNLAIVMPSGENSFYIDQEKSGLLYGSFIGKEVVDVTRRMFPLSNKREDTFIAGISMGGFGSMLVGCRFASDFGAIASLSGGFILDDVVNMKAVDYVLDKPKGFFESIFSDLNCVKGSEKDPLAMAIKAHNEGNLPPMYMACGKQDYVYPCNLIMKQNLEDVGIPFEWHDGDGEHEWTYWDAHIEKTIDWCLALYGKHDES